jgi:hypothetical protein
MRHRIQSGFSKIVATEIHLTLRISSSLFAGGDLARFRSVTVLFNPL